MKKRDLINYVVALDDRIEDLENDLELLHERDNRQAKIILWSVDTIGKLLNELDKKDARL